jgi:polysaccharide export outer membrane protein
MVYADPGSEILIRQLLLAIFFGTTLFFTKLRHWVASRLHKYRLHPALRLTVLALLPLVISFSVSAQQLNTKTIAAPTTLDAPANDLYRIGSGDVIEIRIFKKPELSRDMVRVDNNGNIRMPLIEGYIRAGCRTETELAEQIAASYHDYLRKPQVEVFVKEFRSRPVAVIGAVEKPGRFQLERRVHLLDLLSFAGGPTDKAGARVQVVHSGELADCQLAESGATDELETFKSYDLNATLRGDEKANPYIGPGDMISLPEADLAYVVGDVFKPTTLPLKNPITISQAIAMAGGTLPDARNNRVRLLRQVTGSTNKTELIVDLEAINKRKAEDVVLQPNDIIDVPTSTGKTILRSLINVIAPTAGQLPIRAVRGY